MESRYPGQSLLGAGADEPGKPDADRSVQPFRKSFPQSQITDLKQRLKRVRWPHEVNVGDDNWSQGVPLSYMRTLVQYWTTEYDWEITQSKFNSIAQVQTRIDGLMIHAFHVRSRHANAIPLILTHGWPGNVLEFLNVIGPLTDPTTYGGRAEDAFHLVIPSIPGFGFSERPTDPGWTVERIASAWAELMTRLGYPKFGAQGGDWGSIISTSLVQQVPERIIGFHTNMPWAPGDLSYTADLSAREQFGVNRFTDYIATGSAYVALHNTRPRTAGLLLADSPVAQAAWIVEKLHEWVDPRSRIEADDLLGIITLTWLTNTGASSGRLYHESPVPNMDPVHVPAGFSMFPYGVIQFPQSWVENRFKDVRLFEEVERGGHYAAFEVPDLFVDGVRKFFRLVR
ncbi:epoxide hydrolase [Kitasatospora sp. GP82]|uniref:epoxide hydrolase family protein n=1 Tax=Kitasatospora sp. GP82 TaxID=3035089 RepID=UPI002474034E|nr:epoxide hydrolase [Kitasatospora sp. GP82]MDH6129416.1 pimeloyl-ACP methyl ester carboxylesterase [Kitasatospora sp. GP82]